MRQVIQNMQSGETAVVEVPIPSIRPGTALVRTAASLVSAGTERTVVSFAEKSLLGKARSRPDLVRQVLEKSRREGVLSTVEAAFNRLDQPMALGYSSAGTIETAGEGLQGFSAGDRVACAGGNYAVHAEYGVVPRNLIARIPDEVDFESAAFTTLAAIAMHGFRLSESQVGERVAVIGLGLVGLLACGIASAAGCAVLGIDLDPRRVALAERMGARAAVLRENAEEAALSFSRGRGADSVLICADAATPDPVNLAGVIARDRAHVVAVGAVELSLPRKIYYEKELSFVNSRSYGPGRYDPHYEEGGQDYPAGYVRWTEGRNLEAVLDLMASRRLDVSPLISHRFPIQDAPQAYELLTGKSNEDYLGILIVYDRSETDRSALSLAVPPAPETAPLRKVDTLRVGVLGAGNFASMVMLPAMRGVNGLELTAICSGSGVSAGHAASKFGFRRLAASDEEIISAPDVNTVAVLTRHNLHAAQVCAALGAGKHVFCEKPLALSEEELDTVSAALHAAQDSLLMVGYNRRFAPLALDLRAFLEGRREPLMMHYRVNAGYLPLNHWLHDPAQGGGRILGEGCHFIDFLIYLAGCRPVSVSAYGLPDGGKYRQDNVHVVFDFPDGSLGTLDYVANGDKAFSKERVEVFSGGRAAVLDDFRSLELVHNGRRNMRRSVLRQDKGHRAEWIAFVDAVKQGGLAPIPYTEIFGGTRAAIAAQRSLLSAVRVDLGSAPSAGA